MRYHVYTHLNEIVYNLNTIDLYSVKPCNTPLRSRRKTLVSVTVRHLRTSDGRRTILFKI